ncbi:hypothetical protein T265_09537 [Opisthorchis viverrini]|uniref:Uncharacterized protein n=1 Tax=Opisthorchis viverrini TaxID=6198 RepID=A0A074Z5L8_OPIVI|nr:hypothetical protein T265_09537 [Opisthorchis viverrini]KER22368.1 hypothetical protein T265_09537 [Opisthorchis viverrini]
MAMTQLADLPVAASLQATTNQVNSQGGAHMILSSFNERSVPCEHRKLFEAIKTNPRGTEPTAPVKRLLTSSRPSAQ